MPKRKPTKTEIIINMFVIAAILGLVAMLIGSTIGCAELKDLIPEDDYPKEGIPDNSGTLEPAPEPAPVEETFKPGPPDGYFDNDRPKHLKNQPPDDFPSDPTSETFYVKFFSDGDGLGCILFPRRIKGDTVKRIELKNENETRQFYYPNLDKRGHPRNGGRLHKRLKITGDNYQNSDCIVHYIDGTSETLRIGKKNHPNGYKKKNA